MNFLDELTKTASAATDIKKSLTKKHVYPTMWQLEERLTKEGKINNKQALAFFCPVYFPGQKIVKRLLDVIDEQGEKMLFTLPIIKNPQRIKVALAEMKRLGISNPQQYIVKKKGEDGIPIYSSLPGVEGVGSGRIYEYIGWEAVMLTAFQIVPKEWLNGGDPYNQSYKFPGEQGYSPYWRIPPYKEFQKMRPDLADNFKKTDEGLVKVDK